MPPLDATPKVSIIIPVYNAEKYISQTLNSILNQSYKNIEVILVDDCSSDQSKAVITPFLSESIKYFCEDKNCGGPAGPRNTGIKNSTGDLIMMFDSDDIMLPGKIERSVTCFSENPNIGLLCTGFQSIDNEDNLLVEDYLSDYTRFRAVFTTTDDKSAYRMSSESAYSELFYSNFVGTSSVVIPRVVFDDIGLFDSTLTNGDDRDMWYRVAMKYDFLFVDEPLHQYRINEGGISARGGRNAINRIKVLERQNTPNLPSNLKKQLKKLLASNYLALARYCVESKKGSDARRNVLKSFSLRPSVSAFKLFVKSLMS